MRTHQIRAKVFHRNAGDGGNSVHALRRNLLPAGNAGLVDAKGVSQLGNAAGLLNGPAGGAVQVKGFGHAAQGKSITYPRQALTAYPGASRAGVDFAPMSYVVHILGRSDAQKAVGHRLRLLIKALDLKNTDVAAAMGITKQGLNSILAGRTLPSVYGLYRLSRHQRVNLCDYLVLDDVQGLPHWLAAKLEALTFPAPPAVPVEPERSET